MKIDQSGVKYEIPETLTKYIDKKMRRLLKFVPRADREATGAKVVVERADRPNGDKYEVEVVLSLSDRQIVAKEEAGNPFAAFDIVDEKVSRQIKKYKGKKLLGRIKLFKRK